MMEKIYGVFNSDGSLDVLVKGERDNVYATPLQHIKEMQVDMHNKNVLHYLDENLNVVTIPVVPEKNLIMSQKLGLTHELLMRLNNRNGNKSNRFGISMSLAVLSLKISFMIQILILN